MSILPEGEQLRKAITWISGQKTESPDIPLFRLIEEACLKFDLSPKDEQVLTHFFTEGEKDR